MVKVLIVSLCALLAIALLVMKFMADLIIFADMKS